MHAVEGTAAGASPECERLYALDLLRLVAALLVLLHHWNWVISAEIRAHPAYPTYLAEGGGTFGVSLFFMISGFVILASARGKDVRGFIVSRVVRLYPAFWVCCALSWLVMVPDPTAPNFGEFLVNLTMLPGPAGVPFVDGVYWTLALEAKFYLLIAILLALGRLDRIEAVLWGWLLLAQLGLGLGWSNLVMAKWAPCFIAGCACQLLRERRSGTRVALFAVSALICVDEFSGGLDYTALAATPPGKLLVFAILSAELLTVLAIAMGWIRLRRSSIVVFAGAVSYPLYLLHKEFGYRIIKGWPEVSQGLLIVLAGVVVLGLSAAVVRFEPRLQRWLRHALRPRP
jgi:peptidoglycan/LPS O-acetylase OafA/YrhL